MRLAMEIPKSMLSRLSPLADIDFALAPEVLSDDKYAEFYRTQAEHKRFVILDNGVHEKGHPLTSAELVEAAKRVKAAVVIAPDKLGHYREGIEWFNELKGILPKGHDVGVVMSGNSPAERAEFFMRAGRYAKMLCFPFKEPRYEWFADLIEKIPTYQPWPPRIHLLGVNELDELRQFRDSFEKMGIVSKRVSVDTSKPIKFGLDRKRLDSLQTLRGSGPLKEPEKPPTESQWSDIHYNIALLRRYL
jgi:hypothetical protein